ncbi:MAG: DMT family transporter [Ignavibacteriae bacterium]|nr:DMT family transporter [Ignavibacteria bacterium]MBI3363333.1 DMT family transporter [Ignavibacteriota bacterium]
MSSQRRAELFLLSITIIWGSTFVITKSLLEAYPPYLYTAVRFLLSALILVPFFAKRIRATTRSAIRHGIVLGIFLFIGFVTQTVGLKYTTASKSAFFTGMLTVLTPIVHVIAQKYLPLQHRAIRVGNILGVALAGLGLYLLTSPVGGSFNVGDGLTLICALMFACYIVYLDYASSEPDMIQITFVMFLVCGLLASVFALGEEGVAVDFSTKYILAMLYLIVFATVITMALQNRYQGDTTPTRTAVIFAIEPVVAGIFAYVVRGEMIGVAGMIGGGMILLGLFASEFSDAVPVLRRNVTGM